MKNYRDSELKAIILRSIHSGCDTTDGLIRETGHPEPAHLRSELSMMKRRGFITRSNPEKPWSLTKKGREHCKDPYVSIKRKQAMLDRRVNDILMNNDRFRTEVERLAGKMAANMATNSTQIINKSADPLLNNNEPTTANIQPAQSADPVEILAYKLQLSEKGELLVEKEAEVQRWKDYAQKCENELILSQEREEVVQVKKQVQTQKDIARIKRRQELANAYYNQRRLNEYFFKAWAGNIWPAKVVSGKILRPGSIEILSKSEKEANQELRTHLKKWLTDKEILNAEIVITGIHEQGIIINSPTFKLPYKAKW